MVVLNKAVWFLLSPLTVGLGLILLGFVCQLRRRPRMALVSGFAAFTWLWVWSTQALYRVLGYGLEQRYPPLRAEAVPAADAIVILGGGMGGSTNLPYGEMWPAADRVWHAARLYHAGKAPLVIPSGTGERHASVPLLLDLGVPREAIRVESEARNTEENARCVQRLMDGLPRTATNRAQRVLLVTSAWHMRRALLNFEQTGLEAIPAPADHEATATCDRKREWFHFFPKEENLYRNSAVMKEIAGYWLYRVKYGKF